MNIKRRNVLRAAALGGLAAVALGAAAQETGYAWNWTTLSVPDWEIQVTDFGYSDYLFDRTPGFNGREYLSGEWGAAVAYNRGAASVSPTWLEKRFSFPDFDTNSNFSVIAPTRILSSSGSSVSAESVVGNADLRVTQRFDIFDTVTGVAMGASALSAGGAGQSVLSNRYVLQQTYTFTNVSGQTLDNLQIYQFLHGLNSSAGVVDHRAYGGAMADYRYDLTVYGVSTETTGPGPGDGEAPAPASASVQLRDYLSFHSKVAPSAYEVGHFGLQSVDDHGVGKPSVGTHLSVEAGSLNGVDGFSPAEPWVSGAQRFDLGSLADGQSVSFDVLLTLRTGWVVDGGASGGSVGGVGGTPGQVDFLFQDSHSGGQFFVDFALEDLQSIRELVASGEIGALTFATPGNTVQLFEVEYDGSFQGALRLTFHFDASLFSTEQLASLRVYHWTGSSWEDLGGTLDGNAITVFTDSLSPFAIGVPVPEPATWGLFALGLAGLAWRRRRG